jgi:hypothetical protein
MKSLSFDDDENTQHSTKQQVREHWRNLGLLEEGQEALTMHSDNQCEEEILLTDSDSEDRESSTHLQAEASLNFTESRRILFQQFDEEMFDEPNEEGIENEEEILVISDSSSDDDLDSSEQETSHSNQGYSCGLTTASMRSRWASDGPTFANLCLDNASNLVSSDTSSTCLEEQKHGA